MNDKCQRRKWRKLLFRERRMWRVLRIIIPPIYKNGEFCDGEFCEFSELCYGEFSELFELCDGESLFTDSCAIRLTHCERWRRWAGRRPDFVRKTMQEPRRGSQLGPNCINSLVRRRRTSSDNLVKDRCNSLLALKFAYGAPSLLSSGTKLRGSSTLLHGL